DVETGSPAREPSQDGKTWVGLHRVADEVWDITEGLFQFEVGGVQRPRRIDIRGRSAICSDGFERDRLNGQRPALVEESLHGRNGSRPPSGMALGGGTRGWSTGGVPDSSRGAREGNSLP